MANPVAVAFAAACAGDLAGARTIYRGLIAADPANGDLRYAYGQLLLLDGEFAAGWRECERRAQRAMPFPRWDGSELGGRPILIHGEQGFGDNFQFARYASLVAARGGRVVLAAREGLRPLLATVPGVAQVIEPGEALPPVACHAPMLSLPAIFATDLATIPADVPYLAADPARVASWRARLGAETRLKVGLVWSGHARAAYNARRSPGLAALRPLFEVSGARFYLLQKGDPRAERAGIELPGDVVDLDPAIASFDDTAAAMEALDLVISPCTAPAHLAGALARPVWIPLSVFPDWRWLRGRDDSPWYPTARLFRQERAGDWSATVARMRAALERMVATK